MRRARAERGSTLAELVVGAGLGFVALLLALVLVRAGLLAFSARLGAVERAIEARGALDLVSRTLRRTGVGVPPDGPTDEAVELLEPWGLVVRGDLDAADPIEAAWPETQISAAGAPTTTGNDEVVGFWLRDPSAGSRSRVRFRADLDGPDRVDVGRGVVAARRDGVAERIDAGAVADASEAAGPCSATLYRVRFSHRARHAGTGRFAIAAPIVDGVRRFRVDGVDRLGAHVPACGGDDDATSRECRASLRQIVVTIELCDASPRALRRRIRLPVSGGTR